MAAYYPPVERVPDDYRKLVTQLRAHPAGSFALRMFRLHRGNRIIPGSPRLETEPPHDILGRADDTGSSGGMGPGVAFKPDSTGAGAGAAHNPMRS
ncbi:hypothetical protein EON66_09005 [archaeon]|nr:MAG: hypothetical protein EON66_09005 [archaeon]